MAEKEFVRIEVMGRIHRYHPAINKGAYSTRTLTSVIKDYFEGSCSDAVSSLVENKKLSVADLELLLKQLKKT